MWNSSVVLLVTNARHFGDPPVLDLLAGQKERSAPPIVDACLGALTHVRVDQSWVPLDTELCPALEGRGG